MAENLPIEPTSAPVDAEPELSLADHEAQYGSGSPEDRAFNAPPVTPDDVPEPETEPPKIAPPRDDKGRFERGPRRRARSQQAGGEDVPRIAELTRRLRDTERERDEWKTKAAPAATEPAARPPATPSVAAVPETSRTTPPAKITLTPAQLATLGPKPQPTDTNADGSPKFKTYEEALDARDEWNERRLDMLGDNRREAEKTAAAQAAAAQQLSTSWTEKTNAAKAAHADFEQVAYVGEAPWAPGSLIDAWILEHKGGAEVLYYLKKNPDEIDSLMKLSPFEQIDELSSLSRRLLTPPRASATSTGAVARPPVEPVPRPPTPVRAGPQRAADEPPGDDASLAEHERFYGSARTRRR